VPGTLRVLNSLDAMAKFDWAGAFDADTKRIWGVIAAARDAGTPPPGFARELCRFLLVVHADLKTYKFTHWAAFPALLPPAAFAEAPGKSLRSLSNSRRMSSLCRACDAAEPAAAWCVTVVPHSDLQAAATVSPLEDLWAAPPDGAVRWLAFADPSGTSHAPGWPLRNLLLAINASALYIGMSLGAAAGSWAWVRLGPWSLPAVAMVFIGCSLTAFLLSRRAEMRAPASLAQA
jgi:hypothetical protein